MKLYDAPRNSLVRIIGETTVPPDAPEVNNNEVIKFYHIDGMYSYCKNEYGDIVHVPAWQEVEVLKESKEPSRVDQETRYWMEISNELPANSN